MSRLVSLLSSVLFVSPAIAQAAGLAGGGHSSQVVSRVAAPDAATAERVITIEGIAELRLLPTRLRVVLAASASGKTASEASVACRALLDATRTRLVGKGIAADDIDVDFIAAVPIYEWQVEGAGDKQIAVERRTGSRVQYNLHVAVADENGAQQAIEAATVVDGIDVIAVDYWSEAIAGKRIAAMAQALRAAQDKAKVLLAVFPQPPVPINVHEQTVVLQPQQLYQAVQRADEPSRYGWRDVPQVPATRSTYVYYRGLFADLDVMSPDLPGRRDLHVVATVRLYYAAPERPALPPK